MAAALSARPAEAAPFAYVANHDGNAVSVIDTATNKVVVTVPVGVGPEYVAVTPGGKHAYVTNSGSPSVIGNTVSVIDTAMNKVIATVAVGNSPGGWPSPRMGNTPTWRILTPAPFR